MRGKNLRGDWERRVGEEIGKEGWKRRGGKNRGREE